jgi:hypothetical protein
MKLAVLDAVGGYISYCDPDEFPVGHGAPIDNATARLPQIQADREAFDAILDHEGIEAGTELTDDQLIAINEDYKQMQAIELTPADGGHTFLVYVPAEGSPSANESVSGSVDSHGKVTIEQRGPGRGLECPICLAAGTLIDTPAGPVPVKDLRVGMPVWTRDAAGHRLAGVVVRTGRSVAPIGHMVVRLRLADGRVVVASPGHPTGDGRRIGDLRPGDALDGSIVVRSTRLRYASAFTYDILPSGPTGTYFANGVALASTLFSSLLMA